MCGIAGAVLGGSSAAAESAVREMLPALARRGPDAEGLHDWPGVCFGHRRLAILDLSPAGAQPMLSHDGTCGVVFNGCVYNFHEIRRDLERRGICFRSNCDTEVLIEGYREWGIEALLPRLRGMFAFAIWDEPKQTLTLARDRLGVKPLVFREWDGNIVFASSPRALHHAGFTGEIDPQSALEFFDLGFVTEARCIYKGVRKLPPATVLVWRDGKVVSERQYWDLPPAQEPSPVSFRDAVEETERLIVESVRLRLVSDVPIGALLSGGIDSTLVCWALSKLNADVKAFTVGTPGDPGDESEDARDIAARLGISHEIVHLDTTQPPPLEELGDAYSEPFASSSALGMLRVSRAIQGKATVLLTGDGGDDVFLGYTFFHNAWKAQKLARRLPSGSGPMWRALRPLTNATPALKRARNFLEYATAGIGAHARAARGIPFFEQHRAFGNLLRGRNTAHRETPPSRESARHLMADLFQYHRRMHFLSEFMTKVDGGTTHYSLEARAPFLDQRIWEFAAALPPEIHFHGGRLKAVLREIVRRHVGPEVAFRQKQGFTIPVERWLATQWRSQVEALQDETLLTAEGWFERKELAAAIGASLRQDEIPVQLWYTLVFESWLRRERSARQATPAVSAALHN